MKNLEDKTTNEITLYVIQLKQEHEKTKQDMLLLFDVLERIEKNFIDVNLILKKRLEGE